MNTSIWSADRANLWLVVASLAANLSATGCTSTATPKADAASEVAGADASGDGTEQLDSVLADGSDDATPTADTGPVKVYKGKCAAGPSICDDANPCTSDDCDEVKGCINVVLDCADNDPCTLDHCDINTGSCVHANDPCEDNNACTVGTCKPGIGCTFQPLDCSDGDSCTADGCNKVGGCSSAPLNCDDGQTCTADSCDPVKGCVHIKPDGAQCCETPVDCDQGDPCKVSTCTGGICASQTKANCCKTQDDCADGDPCTLDQCNMGNGTCSNTYQGLPGCCASDLDCDDKLACTQDKCLGHACGHDLICCSSAADCGKSDSCTTNSCTSFGCAFKPLAGASCCTPALKNTGFEAADAWTPKLSQGASGTWNIDSSGANAQAGSSALIFKEFAGAPNLGGVTATATLSGVALPIGRGASLTFWYKGQLSPGTIMRLRAATPIASWVVWQAVANADWQKVTVNLSGYARPGIANFALVLEATPSKNGPGSMAFDGLALASTCTQTVCANDLDCNDNQGATAESCQGGLCVYKTDNAYCEPGMACDDGNACTNDSCVAFKCAHPKKANCCLLPSDCADTDVCTIDSCDFNHVCHHDKKSGSQCCDIDGDCDDANLCTKDYCPSVGLACAHTKTDSNCCLYDKDCDDADGCTLDKCKSNQCTHKAQCCSTDTDCDDKDVCTGDTCGANKICSWAALDKPGCCVPGIFAADFETGTPMEFTFASSSPTVKWQVVTGKTAHGGTGSLWYGNLAAGNYDDGGNPNSGKATLAPMLVPAGATTTFSFWVWMDTEGGTYDDLAVNALVDGGPVELWRKSVVGLQMKQWVQVSLDVSKYSGSLISMQFSFDTVDGIANTTTGTFVDDITLTRTCGAP